MRALRPQKQLGVGPTSHKSAEVRPLQMVPIFSVWSWASAGGGVGPFCAPLGIPDPSPGLASGRASGEPRGEFCGEFCGEPATLRLVGDLVGDTGAAVTVTGSGAARGDCLLKSEKRRLLPDTTVSAEGRLVSSGSGVHGLSPCCWEGTCPEGCRGANPRPDALAGGMPDIMGVAGAGRVARARPAPGCPSGWSILLGDCWALSCLEGEPLRIGTIPVFSSSATSSPASGAQLLGIP